MPSKSNAGNMHSPSSSSRMGFRLRVRAFLDCTPKSSTSESMLPPQPVVKSQPHYNTGKSAVIPAPQQRPDHKRRPSHRDGLVFTEESDFFNLLPPSTSSSSASFNSSSSSSAASSCYPPSCYSASSSRSGFETDRDAIERYLLAYGYFNAEGMDRDSKEILSERVHTALMLEGSAAIEVLRETDEAGLACLLRTLRESLESVVSGMGGC
ncbi:hypothetical protein F5Y16DRAFT_382967 [Xylariaceae sp. FL0255]|nr:hypothetical protein F5Y16DRAFT_382967 [Xylariaceae sp. FL0255]